MLAGRERPTSNQYLSNRGEKDPTRYADLQTAMVAIAERPPHGPGSSVGYGGRPARALRPAVERAKAIKVQFLALATQCEAHARFGSFGTVPRGRQRRQLSPAPEMR